MKSTYQIIRIFARISLLLVFTINYSPSLFAAASVRELNERIESGSEGGTGEGTPLGAFGDELFYLKNNSYVDSYDSRNGPYPGEGVGQNGNARSNISVAIENNATVYGDAVVPPGGTVETADQGVITGDTVIDAPTIELNPIVLPENLNYTAEGDTRILKWDEDEPAVPGKWGDYEISSDHKFLLKNNKKVRFLEGQYRFKELEQMNNSKLRCLGKVEMYIEDQYTLENNSEVLPEITLEDKATHCFIYFMGIEMIDLSNNVEFFGLIYAPDAKIKIWNNDSIYGALMGNELDLRNNAAIHVDEALLDEPLQYISGSSPTQPHERIEWKETITSE